MLTWLLVAEAQGESVSPFPTEPLLQYGVLGIFAVILIYATVRLFKIIQESHAKEVARIQDSHANEIVRIQEAYSKEVSRLEVAYDREVNGRNRVESELSDLNKLINTSLAGELVRATDAIREALENERDRRRL